MRSGARCTPVTFVLLLFLIAAGSASAAIYHGESRRGDVGVTIRTNAEGVPRSVVFGKYKVHCSGDPAFIHRVGSFVPPLDLATSDRIVDREKVQLRGTGGTFAAALKARRSGEVWHGRFHSMWVFKEHGEVVGRCGYAFRFDARLRG